MNKSAKQTSKAKPKSAKTKTSKTAAVKRKASWSDVMKKALEHRQLGPKGPTQPKPRDSGKFKVKKDAF